MKNPILLTLGLAAIGSVFGCGTPKSIDSFHSTVTKNVKIGVYKDPFTFGGVGEGNGGLDSRMSYGSGAKGNNDGYPLLYGYGYVAPMRPTGVSAPSRTTTGVPTGPRPIGRPSTARPGASPLARTVPPAQSTNRPKPPNSRKSPSPIPPKLGR